MSEHVIVVGMSGAGRSQAANVLEDLGWHVIDNLPLAFFADVDAALAATEDAPEKVVLVVSPGEDARLVPAAIDGLRAGSSRLTVVFLDAANPVLVNRYESTRRRHPFGEGRLLTDAIDAEREALAPLRSIADVVIDTTDLNVHELAARVSNVIIDEGSTRPMRTSVISFGFKYGLPTDVDMVLDCRFLPNPHWVPELRPQTGLDEPVRRYVLDRDETDAFLERSRALLDMLIPAFLAEGKSYLTIAFGCTGGHHRSVAIAETIADHLRSIGLAPLVRHRDIHR